MAKYWVTFVCSIGLMLSGCGDDEKNCVPAGEASGSTAGAQTGGVKAGAGGSLIGASSQETCEENTAGTGSSTGGFGPVTGGSNQGGATAPAAGSGTVGAQTGQGSGTEQAATGNATQGGGGNCGNISFAGQCDGTVLLWCQDGELYQGDCAELGADCGYVDDNTGYDCLESGGGYDDYGDEYGDDYWGDDSDW